MILNTILITNQYLEREFKRNKQFLKVGLVMRENGFKIQKQDKEEVFKYGLMDLCMKGTGEIVKLTAKVV